MRAREIQGRWVLIPANICYIVAWAVIQSGNLPYLVDIDPLTGNISPETLDRVQIESPGALIVCHMYGLGAPIAWLCEWAKRRGILVIEDAALALGASVDDRPAGSWGDFAVFSFGEGKIVDVGLGGAFLCDDNDLAEKVNAVLDRLPRWSQRLEQLVNQWNEIYWLFHQYEQANSPLATVYPMFFQIFGDITRYQFPSFKVDALSQALSALALNLNRRLEAASGYDKYFRVMRVQTLPRSKGSGMWRYPLLVAPEDRDGLLSVLWDNGILASRWYPSLVPMLSALCPEIEKRTMPGAEQLGATIINLPVDHTVDEATIERTAGLVQVYFRDKRKRAQRG